MIRRFLEAGDLTSFLRAHRPERQIAQLTRLAEATTKGVYRITYDDETTHILYAWADAENYWPEGPDPAGAPFRQASGGSEFRACHAELAAAGVRVPLLHVVDQSQHFYPADLALVEDFPAGSLEDLLERDAVAADRTLWQFGELLRAMHDRTSPRFGKVGVTGVTGCAEERPEEFAARRALRHLAAAARRAPRLAEAREQVVARIYQLRQAIAPRAEFRLVHGELHPGHVLLDQSLAPVLIDIEGLTYFDVEWEHAFLRIILEPEHYQRLDPPAVDESRVAFYDFAQRLSLIEGPLRIAATDFPRGDFMREIAAYHLGRVLELSAP